MPVLLVGVTVYRAKYRRWPLSLFLVSGTASGRTYPIPAGGVVQNQELSLGGQHQAPPYQASATTWLQRRGHRSATRRVSHFLIFGPVIFSFSDQAPGPLGMSGGSPDACAARQLPGSRSTNSSPAITGSGTISARSLDPINLPSIRSS